MTTRDGVRLDADIYRPDSAGSFPVLLMRQPYGRAIASTVTYAHPSWYAGRGYIVVIQDVRGRGTSEGDFDLFVTECDDGFDTVQWAAALPGSTGAVGMYGFSYQGATQLLAAAARPPALAAICPAMTPWDIYGDMAYEHGAFRLQSALGWAVQLAAETARRRGDASAHQALYAASRNLPLSEAVPTRPALLERLAPDSHYHAWLAHPTPDEYWARRSPCAVLGACGVPALWIGGWYDSLLDGTLRGFRDVAARRAPPQRLVIGPWAHIPWSRRVGAVDFGSAAESAIDELQVRWFDHWLKGRDTGMLAEPPIRLFEMGGSGWLALDRWPDPPGRALYLASSGLAGMVESSGTLGDAPDADIVEDVIVHDPWRPVPTVGGHLGVPAGPADRAAVDARSDVLTYTTRPLSRDLRLAGDVILELWCEADTPSFDVSAVLSEVRADCRVFPLVEGHARVDAGTSAAPLRLPLRSTCVRVPRGHALRLSVAGACVPAYALNLGTGALADAARLVDAGIITLTVRSGGHAPSRVLIPERTAIGPSAAR
jgi:putative CocE/NonD family hydrolase